MLSLLTSLQNTVFLYLDGARQYRECVPLNYGIFEGLRIQVRNRGGYQTKFVIFFPISSFGPEKSWFTNFYRCGLLRWHRLDYFPVEIVLSQIIYEIAF